jgi:cysteine-rich repeat protein
MRLDALAKDLAGGRLSRRAALRRFLGGVAGFALPSVLIAEPALAKCPSLRKCGKKCCPKGMKCKHGKCKCKKGLKKCGKKCCAPGETCVAGRCTGGAVGAVCGNTVAEGSEQCDGTDLRGATCASLGLGSGTLVCRSDCTYDASGCSQATQAVCGNNAKDLGELCDGTDLGGASCQSLGLGSGTLACNPSCQSFDTSGCVMPQCTTAAQCPGSDTECQTRTCTGGTCGFSFAAAGTALSAPNQIGGDCKVKVCDGAGGVVNQNDDADTQADGNDCTNDVCTAGTPSHPPKTAGQPCSSGAGTCDGAGNCVVEICGDGIITASEQCDDGNVAGGDGCSASCLVEPGWSCVGQPSVCSPICGDGIKVGPEDCDGNDLGGASCVDLGFSGGTLACDGSCHFDTSGCTP